MADEANRRGEGNGSEPENGERENILEPVVTNALTSVSASLAALFLEKSVEKGGGVYIPSLDIKVDRKDLSKR